MTISFHCKVLYLFAGIICLSQSEKAPSEASCLDYGDKYCYCISTDKVSWLDAQAACLANGGTLVTISDDDLNEFIRRSLEDLDVSYAWTSGNDRATENSWLWASGKIETYKKWKTGAALGTNENDDCLAIESDTGSWVDLNCNDRLAYVCQKEQDS